MTASCTQSLDSNEIPRVRVSGIPLSQCGMHDVLSGIDANIHGARDPQHIVITNTESMYFARRLPEHARFIESAAYSCCDGIGVVLAGKAQRQSVPRIYGSALLREACHFGVKRRWRHYFYGGRPGVPEMLKDRLGTSFPGMITAGLYSPPFRPLTAREDQDCVDSINRAEPDIVWVGLGLLKQERWIAEHLGRIRAPWMIGVGAAFDYHAGTVRRAPLWMQRAGFEWLHRVICEPRMLVRNYRSFIFLGQSLISLSEHHHPRIVR